MVSKKEQLELDRIRQLRSARVKLRIAEAELERSTIGDLSLQSIAIAIAATMVAYVSLMATTDAPGWPLALLLATGLLVLGHGVSLRRKQQQRAEEVVKAEDAVALYRIAPKVDGSEVTESSRRETGGESDRTALVVLGAALVLAGGLAIYAQR